MPSCTRTLAALAALATAAHAATQVPVTFPPPPSNGVVEPNFFGISLELSFINVYFGNDTKSTPKPIVNLLGAISNHTAGLPIRLRLGGNSMDSSTYVANQSNILTFTNPDANFNDQPVDFGPTLWNVLKKVGDDVGGARYLVGLSLLDPNDPRAPGVPEMAGAAYAALGDDLDAFLLGNEPDLYTGHKKRPQYKNYTVELYKQDMLASMKLLRDTPQGNVIAKADIGAPTVCCSWDLAGLLTEANWLDTFKDELKYITLQHYPQNNCFGSYKYGIDYYLTHSAVVELARWEIDGIGKANAAGKSVVMTEFNSVSCGGVGGVSDTFGTGSLWSLDYALQLASVGYASAYMHNREPTITYNLFDAPSPAGAPGAWAINPPFYAVLVAPEVLGGTANGTRVTDLNLNNGMWQNTSSTDVAGYAAWDAQKGAVARLALFNYAKTGDEKAFTVPADVFTNASSAGLANVDPKNVRVKFLTAKSVSEKWDISYAGLTYSGTGDGAAVPDKSGRPGVQTLDCSKGCTVSVPSPGLAVVFVAGESAGTSHAAADVNATASGSGSGSGANPSATGSVSTKDNGAGALSAPLALGLLALASVGLLL